MEGLRINRFRYNTNFCVLLKEFESRTFNSYDETCTFRDRKLTDFIEWSYKTVPYYRNLFERSRLHPSDFQRIEDLQKLPVLTKSEVQENPNLFVSTNIPRSKRIVLHTSGSTGAGLCFDTTREAVQKQFAIYWRFLGWHGLNRNTWRGYFGGRSIVTVDQHGSPFWRYNLPGKQILFSGYHMSEKNLPCYVEEIRKRKPPWLTGYPSLVILLADYIHDKGLSLNYRLKGIALSSENLLPQQIKKIKEVFGIKPIQDYGQCEAVANFSECEYGNMHVDEDFSAVEFIPVSDDDSYRVIGTNFSNLATPLIRYDTGDIVSLSKEKCSCRRPGRVVKSIDGRKEDYIILKNGVKLGRMDHVFKDLVNIREAQLYQSAAGKIEVRIVKGTNYSNRDDVQLMRELKKRVGEESEIAIKYMERLPRTAHGKLRFVISDII
jgi:phenylacetate-CoA ligase